MKKGTRQRGGSLDPSLGGGCPAGREGPKRRSEAETCSAFQQRSVLRGHTPHWLSRFQCWLSAREFPPCTMSTMRRRHRCGPKSGRRWSRSVTNRMAIHPVPTQSPDAPRTHSRTLVISWPRFLGADPTGDRVHGRRHRGGQPCGEGIGIRPRSARGRGDLTDRTRRRAAKLGIR